MQEGIVMLTPDEGYVAATAPISAAGTAPRDILLAPESQTAVAPVSGFNGDRDVVDEHDGLFPNPRTTKPGAAGNREASK
jgi:hypothetical protein